MVTTSKATGIVLPGWLSAILRIVITAALPLMLVLINARVLMSPLFMNWEYNRPNFSPDPYGFTAQDRLYLGPLGLAYLFNNQGIEFLGDLTLPDGTAAFNERELSHMHDVKLVTQKLVRFGFGLLAGMVIAIGLLAASQEGRGKLAHALFDGSVLTVLLLIAGIAATALAFDWLFATFHSLFFQGNTWIFPTSDTLIRLYPEPFWIDAFAFMFGGALVQAIVIGVLSRRWMRRQPA